MYKRQLTGGIDFVAPRHVLERTRTGTEVPTQRLPHTRYGVSSEVTDTMVKNKNVGVITRINSVVQGVVQLLLQCLLQ